MPREIAALYVETNGVYYGLEGVDPWDEKRGARNYTGPYPVVAHPPCQLWTNLTGVNWKRYGGSHNRPGNDGGCFAHALRLVIHCGGVLEHPAGSYAWNTFGLQAPTRGAWSRGSFIRGGRPYWVTEVSQSAYGHSARKRTWLLWSPPGIAHLPPSTIDWSNPKGTHQIGWFDRSKPTLGKKAASATPPAFRAMLISMARSVEVQHAA